MRAVFSLCLLSALLLATSAVAEDAVPEQRLNIKGHAFAPQELTVPANRKVKLIIQNDDATSAEFESDDLGREKVVPANGSVSVYLDPLEPGTYEFFDDFHHDTTGKIIAKP